MKCSNCKSEIKEGDGFCQNCGHRIVSFSTAPTLVSPVISKKAFFIIPVIAVLLAVIIIVSIIMANKPLIPITTPIPTPITTPASPVSPELIKSKTITNPDYLKNPSDYLIDDKNKFSWGIKDQIVWVEGSVDSSTLKLSTVIDRGGARILKVVTFYIPWLQNFANYGNYSGRIDKEQLTSNEHCWEDGAHEWLKQNILGKRIAFLDEGSYYYAYSGEISGNYRWLIEDDSGKFTVDLAAFVIANGYGRPGFGNEDAEKKYANNSYGTGYFRQLKDLESVASLAMRGLWGTCQ